MGNPLHSSDSNAHNTSIQSVIVNEGECSQPADDYNVFVMLFLSFCSFSDLKENEDVVEAALKANNDRFTLEHCLPSWTHRGKDVFQGGRFGRQQNAEPYSMEYPMEYLKWSTPKNHVLVK